MVNCLCLRWLTEVEVSFHTHDLHDPGQKSFHSHLCKIPRRERFSHPATCVLCCIHLDLSRYFFLHPPYCNLFYSCFVLHSLGKCSGVEFPNFRTPHPRTEVNLQEYYQVILDKERVKIQNLKWEF